MKNKLKKLIAIVLVATMVASMITIAVSASTQTTDALFAGQILYAGQYIQSSNGMYTAIMQSDGNFVIYRGNNFIAANASAATMTHGNNNAYFAFQFDGNIVVYNQSNKAIWSPLIHGKGATKLVMQSDGNLVAYTSAGKAVWASNTVSGGVNKTEISYAKFLGIPTTMTVMVYVSHDTIKKVINGNINGYDLAYLVDLTSAIPLVGTLIAAEISKDIRQLERMDEGNGVIVRFNSLPVTLLVSPVLSLSASWLTKTISTQPIASVITLKNSI